MLASWLSYDDLERLVVAALTAPVVGHTVVYGMSDNPRSWWDNSGAARLGYRPTQNSEDYAAEILVRPNPLDAVGRHFQGGVFVSPDYTRGDIAPD